MTACAYAPAQLTALGDLNQSQKTIQECIGHELVPIKTMSDANGIGSPTMGANSLQTLEHMQSLQLDGHCDFNMAQDDTHHLGHAQALSVNIATGVYVLPEEQKFQAEENTTM